MLDAVVDSYLPLTEKLEDTIETLEDQVVEWPRPSVLEDIGEIRGTILQFRRVVNATRHIASQLRHIPEPLIARDLSPFLRDVHDDLAIILDLIAGDRDRLAAVLDIYLSSVANRTTEATKTLTLLGTVAVPALVITSLFGMNIEYPAWTRSPWLFTGLIIVTAAVTLSLLWYLRRGDYLPGGTPRNAAHESVPPILVRVGPRTTHTLTVYLQTQPSMYGRNRSQRGSQGMTDLHLRLEGKLQKASESDVSSIHSLAGEME